MKLRVKLLGWTMVALGAAGVALIAWLIAELAKADATARANVLPWLAPLLVLGTLVYVAPLLVGGVGLLVGWKPAKWIIGTVCVLMLPAVPVGTAIGMFGLWGLLGDRLAKRAEAQAAEAQAKAGAPMISPRRKAMPRWSELPPQVQTLIVMGVSLGILGAMIGLGYVFREQLEAMDDSWMDTPGERRLIALGFGVVFAAGLVGFRFLTGWRPGQLPGRRKPAPESAEMIARKAWIEGLKADPVRKVYAEKIAAGEWWSPERVAYHMDKERTATCEHLRNLERAMRLAGIDVRYEQSGAVEADCWIYDRATPVLVEPPAAYTEDIVTSGRSYEDPRGAAFTCSACGSWIRTVHPKEKAPETPVFPTRGPEYQH